MFQLESVLHVRSGWLSSAWSSFFYYTAWILVYHSVSCECWADCTIPTSVLKPEFNRVKALQFLASSVVPFLNKIVNSLGAFDFAFFHFSKIALQPWTKLTVLNRQWILHKCQLDTPLFPELSFISIAFIKLPTPRALSFAPFNLNFFFWTLMAGRNGCAFSFLPCFRCRLPLGEVHSYHSQEPLTFHTITHPFLRSWRNHFRKSLHHKFLLAI